MSANDDPIMEYRAKKHLCKFCTYYNRKAYSLGTEKNAQCWAKEQHVAANSGKRCTLFKLKTNIY